MLNRFVKGRCKCSITVLLMLLLALVTALGLSCGAPSFDSETLQKMEDIVDGMMDSEEIPGVIVGVWIPERGTWELARGESDIETGEKIETDDKVRIGSVSKSFTATVVLQLVDEGKLSLDDKVDEYIPGVPNGSEITIRQMLNMTSGLYDFHEDEALLKSFAEDPLMKMTPQEKLDIAFAHDPHFAPGEGFHYSDTNYVLLAMIIEKLTGCSASEAIRKYITEPLGLKNTSLPTTPDMTGNYSHNYEEQEDGELIDYTRVDPSVPWVGGGMVSNLYDLKVWVKALAEGELISDKMHKEQLTFVDIPGGEAINIKYGLGVYSFDGFIGHSGKIFGFNCAVYYLPEEDATLITITNKAVGEDSQEAGIMFMGLANVLFEGKFSGI